MNINERFLVVILCLASLYERRQAIPTIPTIFGFGKNLLQKGRKFINDNENLLFYELFLLCLASLHDRRQALPTPLLFRFRQQPNQLRLFLSCDLIFTRTIVGVCTVELYIHMHALSIVHDIPITPSPPPPIHLPPPQPLCFMTPRIDLLIGHNHQIQIIGFYSLLFLISPSAIRRKC